MPFREIIGHRRIVALLARSARRASLPPSLIFAGPSGIGKRLAAVATAQALNCLAPIDRSNADATEPLERDACGTCAACRRIARGTHPDVLIVEPGDSGSIKIDQVRDVIERAGYRPFEGRRRLVIFDDADALGVPAQSALLKILEEPPPSSVFILVTARPDVLLPTVLSRCPTLRFRPLSAAEIASALKHRGHSETEAWAIAATAEGSLGQALAASAGALIEARDVATDVLVHAAATGDPRRRIEGAKRLLTGTSGGAADRDRLGDHLRAMASLIRDVELLSTRADVNTLANPDVKPVLEGLAHAFEGERGMRAFSAVDQALLALERNSGVKVVADWLVLQL